MKPWQKILVEKTAELVIAARMLFDKAVKAEDIVPFESDRRFHWFNNQIRRNLEQLGLKAGPGTGTPRKKADPATTDPTKPTPKPSQTLEELLK